MSQTAPSTMTAPFQYPNSSTAPILCLGMARTGTASLTAALRILGFHNIHHGLEINEDDPQWIVLDREADATFPSLPTYTGKPFTRAEWDEVFGSYDAVTDIASFFGTSLIRAYPDAPVILIERDIDKWLVSIDQILRPTSNIWMQRLIQFVEPVAGSLAGRVMIKVEKGWTEAREPKEILTNARMAYIRHYREIREAVPKDQLLDLQLKDGWEPLCKFLGKEVPSIPFPHINDAAEFQEHTKRSQKRVLKNFAKNAVLLRCKSRSIGT